MAILLGIMALLANSGDPCIWGVVLLVGGIFIYRHGLGRYYLKKTIEYTPTSKAVSVAPGIAEVSGAARQYKQIYAAPYSKKSCLFYSTSLYRWSGSGKSRHRDLVKTWTSSDPFYIEDETGKILIQPTLAPTGGDAESMVKRDIIAQKNMSGQNFISKALFGDKSAQEADNPVRKFVAESYPSLSSYNDVVDVEETFIENGDPMYALGTAELFNPDDPNPQMIIVDDGKKKFFCLADGTEKDALSHISWEYYLSIVGGPLLFFIGYAIIMTRFEVAASEIYLLGAAIAAAMYLWMVQLWLLAIYNGLVVLKNNCERAKSNIDVLLQKRHDLVPELVEIVKGYSIHERTLFAKLADLRSQSVADASKSLLAIAENYPQLMANQQFKLLQEQLARIETEIAGSRTYYNDSVVLYNKQIESFPHMLAAKFARMKPLEFFQWED